jgi:UDP-N-acetylmuramate--alanine ligase
MSVAEVREILRTGTVHFMGIGGAGMCALAEAMVRQGGRVTGCDTAPGGSVEPLRKLGVPVFHGHDPAHVEGVAALVTTAAVPSDHPELARARALDLPILKRARALGEWVNAGDVVAVSGTHGKTTTTAMTTEILARAGMAPTGFVGGWVTAWGGHLRPGSDALYVVEADEYDRSFHHLRPTVAVVTNMEPDHLDIYGDFDGVRDGFRTFLGGVREGGTVVACADDSGASSLFAGLSVEGRSFGFSAGSQLRALDLETSASLTRFRVVEDGRDRGTVAVPIPGAHNAKNALGAAAAARAMGAGWEAIREALADFTGVARRFQRLGEAGGITVVDDYAHHPTELAAAIASGRQFYPDSRLVAVFQPHLYTRTRDFADEFARVLATADVVWMAEIYPAREPAIPGVDGAFLARAVEKAKGGAGAKVREVILHTRLDELAPALGEWLRPGDLCLTLGAGSIERVGPALVERLRAAGPRRARA